MGAMSNHAMIALPAHGEKVLPEEQHPGADQNGNTALNPDFTLVRGDYRVRLANEESRLHARASRLVTSMYGSRGLEVVRPAHAGRRPEHRQREQVTLAASHGHRVFGTLTLRVDSGASLLADSLYRPEVDELRTQGGRLCEVTRLALDPELSCPEVMATLFHVAFVLASEVHDRTDLIAEVHPRHAGFYQRTMGYRVVGRERICPRVGAPAVLMHLCLGMARRQIRQYAGSCSRKDRNLYRLFLTPAEEQVLLEKLTGS